ncbi:hypothetical protein ONZ45_g5364 [Pleurotus djamor]|nr:hypothetical protein ONZ45_g5364 [Pleurotus djamor]
MYATFLRHVSLGDIPAETSMRGCHIKFEDNATYISFLVLMAFEIIMLILTVIKGLRDLHPKIKYSSSSSSSFLFKFYQDGVLYYTVLAAVSFANAMVLLFADREFALVLLAPQRTLHSIFSARILLRLREDACRRAQLSTLTAPVGDSIFIPATGTGEEKEMWDHDMVYSRGVVQYA